MAIRNDTTMTHHDTAMTRHDTLMIHDDTVMIRSGRLIQAVSAVIMPLNPLNMQYGGETMTATAAIDFRALDRSINFNYRDDLYDALSDLDYDHASQMVYDYYYRKKLPASAIAKALPISLKHIYAWMDRWGFDRRQRGGNLRNPKLNDDNVRDFIMSCKGSFSMTQTADLAGCSRSTVKNIWAEGENG